MRVKEWGERGEELKIRDGSEKNRVRVRGRGRSGR